MTNKKYDILETILENIFEQGTDVEASLAEFPEYADELRPLLQAALASQEIAPAAVPDDVLRRGRARLLQQAAQMRDAASAPRASLFDFRFASVALGLVLIFLISGAGLISVSASSLPGDSLYPVKLGWESAHFWFADEAKTASLKVKYEEERREEVQALLGGRRLATVQFEGVVASLNGSKWEVAGVPVILSVDAQVEAGIAIGADVIVSGQTQSDGTVLATKIVLSGHSEDQMPAEDSSIEELEEKEGVDSRGVTLTPKPESEDDEDDGDKIEKSGDNISRHTPEADDSDDGDKEDDDKTSSGTSTPTPDGDGEEDDDDPSDDDD